MPSLRFLAERGAGSHPRGTVVADSVSGGYELSPSRAGARRAAGYEAIHWAAVVAANAPDTELMAFAYRIGGSS